MIDLKTAVSSAQTYLQSIQDIMGDLQDLRLEEVELSKDKKYWLITLGYDIPVKTKSLLAIGTPLVTREYKIFKVSSETGEVEAMKIRKI